MEFKDIKITPDVKTRISENQDQSVSVIISLAEGYSVDSLLGQVLQLPGINRGKVDKTENYVFAELTTAQINLLQNYAGVKKIWLDKEISTMAYDDSATDNSNIPGEGLINMEKPVFFDDITWAVIDSGIDARHEALVDSHVVDVDLTGEGPVGGHGTHVAGIIAGWFPSKNFTGVAPKCRLYNYKIVGQTNNSSKLVIKAMEAIRKLNQESEKMVIHGANLSWGIPFTDEIKLYQPGLSPICEEANRLVHSGVILCVSAGNYGAQTFNIPGTEGAQVWATVVTSTIADPGSAELPITVGSTHKDNPEKYGISIFSSKGPTADGRPKPDLVAPGEKILSCIPGNNYQVLSGTSQAAPYVSGIVVQLLHAYPYLIGQPMLVKSILMDSARNLNRAPAFQGKGVVDLNRAMQLVRSIPGIENVS
jgi:subtilisin family serine protease